MQNNGQGPFLVPVAFPQPQGPPQLDDGLPVRIRAAMEFISLISAKQAARAAVWDSGCEWADKLELSKAEANARESAANLLAEYFSGKMDMDQWESEKYLKAKLNKPYPSTEPFLMKCVSCSPGRGREDCPLCRGSGQVLIYPRPTGE